MCSLSLHVVPRGSRDRDRRGGANNNNNNNNNQSHAKKEDRGATPAEDEEMVRDGGRQDPQAEAEGVGAEGGEAE